MSNKFWPAIALTGGAAGALDAIDGALLSGGDMAMVITSTGFHFYYLNAASASTEISPNFIVPDANPDAKVWHLLTSVST